MSTSGDWYGCYRLPITGSGIKDEIEIESHVPDQRILIRPQDEELQLEIEIRDEQKSKAEFETLGQEIATAVFRTFILRLADRVKTGRPPQLTSSRVETFSESGSVEVVSSGGMVIGGKAEIRIGTGREYVEEIMQIALTRAHALPPPQLQPAMEVFLAGLEVEDAVTRFLIHYNALALLCELLGRKTRQKDIDGLIIETDPKCSKAPTGQRGGDETLFTKARNDLIHAHDRGQDPTTARKVIETQVRELQRIVAFALETRLY